MTTTPPPGSSPSNNLSGGNPYPKGYSTKKNPAYGKYVPSNTGFQGLAADDWLHYQNVAGQGTGSHALGAFDDNPSIRSGAVIGMMRFWGTIDVNLGGTQTLRQQSDGLIPREPDEPEDAYQRRVFHSTMPPFLQRLAQQAAGSILRKGIHLEGSDYWQEWRKDVTGTGITLDSFAHRWLEQAILYGHSSLLVDYANDVNASTLREERRANAKPYFNEVLCQKILGWRLEQKNGREWLTQLRVLETVSLPDGRFGETIIHQVRVMEAEAGGEEPVKWQVWRDYEEANAPAGAGTVRPWAIFEEGELPTNEIPVFTIYGARIATLTSKPPLLEIAHLCVSYAQRFADYHNSIHVGAMPQLVLKGFDPPTDEKEGTTIGSNFAYALPPDGDAFFVEPTSAGYDSQLRCLETLEGQINRLGISTLMESNLTNASAKSKHMDRVDSDSIMAQLSRELEQVLQKAMDLAARYAGIDAPKVTVPLDFEARILDGNQTTALLQLFMQGAISQATLLDSLKTGEVLSATLDTKEEIARTQELVDEQMAIELAKLDLTQEVESGAQAPTQAEAASAVADKQAEAEAQRQRIASDPNQITSAENQRGDLTIETPMRSGRGRNRRNRNR